MLSLNPKKRQDLEKQKARRELEEKLEGLKYDLPGGRTIQTRPKDQQNIQGKIEVIKAGGSDKFIMIDNKPYSVTVAELEEAMAAGMLAASALWDEYMAKIEA